MTTKNILLTIPLSLFMIFSITLISNFEAFAEEEISSYRMADNVKSIMTFTFRDGVEVIEFPVYSMTDDFVSNRGTSFEVEGVIGDSPLFHHALDEAYKYRLMLESANSSFEYDFRYFDVDVDFVKGTKSIGSIGYYKCEIANYRANTLDSADFESYFKSSSGFAIVDEVEFDCRCVNSNEDGNMDSYYGSYTDYTAEPLTGSYADDVRSYLTLDFQTGTEKIEVHGFEINSAFAEGGGGNPSFSIEYLLEKYPILGSEIDKARKISSLPTGYNHEFDVLVEFKNSEKTLRSLDYSTCEIDGAEILTRTDKEEGFTGKSGFALVQTVDFTCTGLTPGSNEYREMNGTTPVWNTNTYEMIQPAHSYNTGQGAVAMATFTYDDGIEILGFPIFDQENLLNKSNPTFTLEGIVGDFPMLYPRVDENFNVQSVTGSSYVENFDVDIELMYGEESVREFNYSDCRVIDYDVGSDMNKEESYIKGQFALETTFNFECRGYTPNSPVYDEMFETTTYAKTPNTNSLRDIDDWGPGFKIE